jgi:hypothetical protein
VSQAHDGHGSATGMKDIACSGTPASDPTSWGENSMLALAQTLQQISDEMEMLAWVGTADPIADAQQAVKRRDYTLFMLFRNLQTSVPGLEPPLDEIETRGHQVHQIVAEDVTGLNAAHDRLVQQAIDYATKYNRFIMLHKKEVQP